MRMRHYYAALLASCGRAVGSGSIASAGEAATLALARASSAEARELRNRRMIEWFQQNGGTLFDSLEYRYSQGGVRGGGMFTTAHIPIGSVLCSVPAHLVFDPLQPAGSDPRLPSSTETPPSDEFELSLAAAKVLTEALQRSHDEEASSAPAASTGSFFDPYLASLPRECESVICGSPLPDDIPVTHFFHREVEIQRQQVPPEHLLAYSLFRSRAWYPGVLVPVLDLFNHNQESGRECETLAWVGGDDDDFTPESTISLRAGRNYSAGEEVWISYGKLTANAFHTLIYKNFVPSRSADGVTIFSEALLPRATTEEQEAADLGCDDMIYFRHAAFNGARKAKCLNARASMQVEVGDFPSSPSSAYFEAVLAELKWAIETRDLPTLKGLGGWLDKHLRARDEVESRESRG